MLVFFLFLAVLVNVSNQKPPLLEPKPAKTRPKNFYQKTTSILGQTATILEILKWRSWIFCKYLWCSQKNVKILLFSTRPKEFFPPQESPKPPKTRQPATFTNTEHGKHYKVEWNYPEYFRFKIISYLPLAELSFKKTQKLKLAIICSVKKFSWIFHEPRYYNKDFCSDCVKLFW